MTTATQTETITVEMTSAVGPRVIYSDGIDAEEIDREIPDGYSVDYSSQVRTDTGDWSSPLVADEPTPSSKTEIENAAAAGLSLDHEDVVTVNEARNCVTQIHEWTDSDDGRALDAVTRTSREAAQEIANKTGRQVEIYSSDDCLLNVVEPQQ